MKWSDNSKDAIKQTIQKEISGYQLDSCFGTGGCPNRVMDGTPLLESMAAILSKTDLKEFLSKRVNGPLKFHHQFRVTLSECPNACSQPQIKDFGIIAAAVPIVSVKKCSFCGRCAEICQERAIALTPAKRQPVLIVKSCLFCGKCVHACPTETLKFQKKGYRVQLGGKLGRHPRLAQELPGLFSEEKVIEILKKCLKFYQEKARSGKRFPDVLAENPSFIAGVNK